MINSLILANAPDELIEESKSRLNRSNFEQCEIWEENVSIFNQFINLQTQWNIDGQTGYVFGFTYSNVVAYLQLMVEPDQIKEIFNGIQIMERAALPFLNKKKDQ